MMGWQEMLADEKLQSLTIKPSVPVLRGSVGLFISPAGECFPVSQSHINTVTLNPVRFGVTTQEIKAAYAKHREPVGVEGSAREEILCDLVMKGWIRLRRYVRPQEKWSATVNKLDHRTRALLKEWAEAMLAGTMGFREDDPYKTVVVSELATGFVSPYAILKMADKAFLATAPTV